jgi:superfamily II DNA/RNA helicase
VNLSAVTRVVLDEADRMADMGFMPAVRRLLYQTSDRRQTLLFSATLDRAVAKLTHEYQRNPVHHDVGEETPDVIPARHLFWSVAKDDRTEVAAAALNAMSPGLVFCRTRHGADRLAKRLRPAGIEVAAIHGGRSQNQRTRALADFSSGRATALVATDVAARGIHVDGVALVLHHDPPVDHKTYVHRSGRTARAGHGGVVLSLVQPDQVRDFRRLQRAVGLDQKFTVPDTGALFVSSSIPGTEGMPVRAEASDTRASDELAGTPPRQPVRRNGRRRRNPRNRRGGRRLQSVS